MFTLLVNNDYKRYFYHFRVVFLKKAFTGNAQKRYSYAGCKAKLFACLGVLIVETFQRSFERYSCFFKRNNAKYFIIQRYAQDFIGFSNEIMLNIASSSIIIGN